MTDARHETDIYAFTEHLAGLIQNQDAEERRLSKKREKMGEKIEKKMQLISELEMEKAKLDDEVLSLRLRDKAYQKEHTNLRNSITIIKFQIEKIKESIEKTKKSELEELKEFERTVDEITEKFRTSPAIYDRRSLLQKLNEEKEKRKLLFQRMQETREAYANFNKEKGLRERSNENEELLNCVLPGSELYYLIQMTKNLDEVISDMKKHTSNIKESENKLKELDASIHSVTSKITALKSTVQGNDTNNLQAGNQNSLFGGNRRGL